MKSRNYSSSIIIILAALVVLVFPVSFCEGTDQTISHGNFLSTTLNPDDQTDTSRVPTRDELATGEWLQTYSQRPNTYPSSYSSNSFTTLNGELFLTTLFASNNGFAGNMFDVEVNVQLTITRFEINISDPGTTNTIEVYYRMGTCFGHENSPVGWILLGTDNSVVSNGTDNPTPVNIGGLTLEPGQVYGFYVNVASYPSAIMVYTNGGPTTFSNAQMSLTTNCGKGSPAFTGSTFFYRQWNGTIYYNLGPSDDLRITPPEEFVSSGEEGGPFTPSSKTYTLTNVGPNSLDWTAAKTQSWLDLTPGTGTLGPGDSNTVVVYLTADVDTLPPGNHNDTVTFTNMTSGFAQTRDVMLEVIPVPAEIEVTDSIPPPDDLNMPFGNVIIGLSRSEHITITNTDPNYSLVVTDISLGGGYFEDFNDGLAQDWDEDVSSNWEVVSGEYRAQSDGTDFMFSRYLGQEWEDLSAQMNCRRTGNIYTSASLVLRATSDFDDGIGSGYVFQLTTNGSYSIWKQISGSWSWLQSWTYSSAINPGTNVLMVNAEGNQLKFFINGTLIWSGTDNDLASGHIGLGGYTEPAYATTHYFDNVVVTEPETTSQTISDEQRWYNEYPYEGGSPEAAPEDWQPPAYPGNEDEPAGAGLTGPASLLGALSSGGFVLENIPDLNEPIPPLGSITFDVNFTPAEVKDYEATLVIASTDEDEPEVEVQLSGRGIPDYLEIIPDVHFEFSGHPGGPFVPTYQYYQLTNIGPISIDWTAEPNVPWLDVSPSSGTLQPGEPATVTVWPNAQAEDMNEGYYCGHVNFLDITTTLVQRRAVCLDVYTEPKIWVSPYSFDITIPQGCNDIQILTIGNTGGSALNFSLSSREIPGYLPAAKTTVSEVEISEDKMVLEYEFNEPIIYEGDDYDWLTMEGLEQYQRVGAPIIPVRPVKVMVPFGNKVLTTRTILLETYDLPGSYWLPPAQKPYPLNYEGTVKPTEPDPAIYGQATPWPGINHEEVAAQSKRGYQMFFVNLFPLQYVPTTGKISYASKLRLEIDLVDAPTLSVLRPSDTVKSELSATVDNPTVLEAYPESDTSLETLGQPTALPPGGPYQYVIITNETLEAAPGSWNFQALRDAKIARGLTAAIVTTEWIYANYDGTRPDGGSDNQTRIRNFLIDAYQTWGTEYVLLGGTNGIVPARRFRVDGEKNMPVDMYYGCVDPPECTFDYDADGWYGEPTDGIDGNDVDLLAEIYVGRAPVENATELENFIKKTLTYDLTQNEYLSHIAMLGEWLGFGGVSEYAKDSKEQIRLGGEYDGYFTYGFENHTQSSFIDFITEGCLPEDPTGCWPLYDKDYYWPKSDLINLMDGGVHVFNHLGHANETHCMKLSASDLASLTNTDYFFAYSQGCDPGAFDTSNCFAEVITSMEHGAFAVVMNARSGWGKGNSTDGPSHRFDRQFWDAVLGEGILEVGWANQDSKEDNLWDINGSRIRYCYYELNLFGDPAQRLRFTQSCDWMDFVPEAGIVVPGEAIDVNVVFNAEEVIPGTHQGEITILSGDPYTPGMTIPVTMTVEPIDYFTELFEPDVPFNPNDPNCNDMAYRTLTFRPGGSNYYEACISEANDFPVDPNGGTIISLGDDDYVAVDLSSANINFYGTNYETFYIGSNGYISFISGDIRHFETLADHFDLPRVSALFDDLNPSAGGTISWKQLDDKVVVTFENVPEYSLSNSNSFQIEMRFNGKIRITFLEVAAKDGLVGLSKGDGLPPYFTESDLSEYDLCTFRGDLNGDQEVDLVDFAIFGACWQNRNEDMETVRDEFNTVSYSGNDGTMNWNNNWQESGESDGPSSGLLQVVPDGSMRLGHKNAKDLPTLSLTREADLSGATEATLTYEYVAENEGNGGYVSIQVSGDGGLNWDTLANYPYDAGSGLASFDITQYISSNTQIRFVIGPQTKIKMYLHIDNIQIEYDDPDRPWYPWCNGSDFNQNFIIDFYDLLIFVEHWLE